MSDISQRILHLIKEKNLSYGELSKLSGISKSTLQRYATGVTEKIPFDKLERIANALNTPAENLLGWNTENDITSILPNAIPIGNQCKLPIIGKVSAGMGTLAYDDILGYEIADERYCNGEYFYLRVIGDSMSPKIDDGDLVLVHKQDSVDSGNYAVVTVDGEDGCVKVVKYGKNWIQLHSINPYYPVREFKDANVLEIRVIGKVIKIIREP